MYTDALPAKVVEENAKAVVKQLDVAYWPERSAVCFFCGQTPVAHRDRSSHTRLLI